MVEPSRCERPSQNKSLEELIGTIGGSTRSLVDNKDLLPNEKDYLRKAEPLMKDRYGAPTVPASELRRIKAALYRGDLERPKRTRPKHKG